MRQGKKGNFENRIEGKIKKFFSAIKIKLTIFLQTFFYCHLQYFTRLYVLAFIYMREVCTLRLGTYLLFFFRMYIQFDNMQTISDNNFYWKHVCKHTSVIIHFLLHSSRYAIWRRDEWIDNFFWSCDLFEKKKQVPKKERRNVFSIVSYGIKCFLFSFINLYIHRKSARITVNGGSGGEFSQKRPRISNILARNLPQILSSNLFMRNQFELSSNI